MAKRKGSSSSCPRTSCPRTSCPRSQAANEGRDATDVESTQRLLEKLPPEVWRKILAELDWNDLFPLALSCKFFRQKQLQKAQAARTRRDGPESDDTRSYLETNLRQKLDEGQPASVEYLRFLRKEEELRGVSTESGDEIMCLAAFHGYLPKLQEDLKGLGDGPWNMITREVAEYAARGGQLETLQWLRTYNGFVMDEELFSAAGDGGDLEIMKWLRSEGCAFNEWACSGAASGGHLEALKWLMSEGCPWDAEACNSAAEGGHLEVLKWLRSEGCPWDEGACIHAAAEKGHLDVLKYLHENGCPCDEETCAFAAAEGHLDVLEYLHENGCPWDEKACDEASKGGHLVVLKYLHEKGCSWDKWTCYYHYDYAAKRGHADVLKLARENGCPWSGHTAEILSKVTRERPLKCPFHVINSDDYSDDDYSEEESEKEEAEHKVCPYHQ